MVLKLASELSAIDQPTVMFLDDFHEVTSAEVHDVLNYLIKHANNNFTWVIASRSVPSLALSSLKLAGRLHELAVTQMSFGARETKLLLNQIQGLGLSEEELKVSLDKTEGWVAGLQLMSLALRSVSDRSRFLIEFSGSDREVTDYLGAAIMGRQSRDIREVLMRTAVLDRFCVELCQFAADSRATKECLRRIEQANLFLIPLDRERRWYRYHNLFTEFLRNELETHDPQAGRQILERASVWCADRGLTAEAMRYALRAGDLERAADIVASSALELVQHRGEHATLKTWLGALPKALVDARPVIRVAAAWSAIFTRRLAEADEHLYYLTKDNKVGLNDSSVGGIAGDKLLSAIGMLRCLYYALTDQVQKCRSDSEAWLARWPAADPLKLGTVGNAYAYACLVEGDVSSARASLAKARNAFLRGKTPYGVAWADVFVSTIEMAQGNLNEAIGVLESSLLELGDKCGGLSYATSMHCLLLGEARYEQGDLQGARARLDQSFQFIEEHGTLEMAHAAYVTQARLHYCDGEAGLANSVLEAGERFAKSHELPRLLRTIRGERILLHLQTGEIDAARSLAESGEFTRTSGDNRLPVKDIDELVVARLRIEEGRVPEALRLLSPAIRRCKELGRNRALIRFLIARTIAESRHGHPLKGLRHLDEALALGAQGGFIQVFVEDARSLREQLSMYIFRRASADTWSACGSDASQAYVQRVSELVGCHEQYIPTPTTDGMPADPLSRREGQLLRLLEKGLSNRALAETLFVSEATIKWHLNNIFNKLDVKNRTAAIAAARRQGFI
ncbi:MAG: hypothetical protein HY853_01745 [Burkholderiales bacterium]|nr:hypothetical protein [Burkholderiales bacterium]